MSKQIFRLADGSYYTEQQFMDGSLRFLYENPLGRLLLGAAVARPWFSRLFTARYDRPGSVRLIAPFIEQHGIDMSEYPERAYASFNDFFTRSLLPGRRPFPDDGLALAAPADSKLSMAGLTDRSTLHIKGFNYGLAQLLGSPELAAEFAGGTLLLFRLSVDDCHRYCFIDDGELLASREIPGRLHSVGPITDSRRRILTENQRRVTLLATRHFGRVACVEVGALLVGRIVNHPLTSFRRGQEKGYFAFGGSTIVLVFGGGVVEIDEEVEAHCTNGFEVKVQIGERIGRSLA